MWYCKVGRLPGGWWSLVSAPAAVWRRPQHLWASLHITSVGFEIRTPFYRRSSVVSRCFSKLRANSWRTRSAFCSISPASFPCVTCAAPSKTSGSAYFWLHSIKKRQHTHAQTFWVYVFLHCTKGADFPTMPLAVCCSVLMTLQHVCSSMFPCVSNQPLATSNLTLFYLHIFIYDSNGPNLRLDEAAAIWAFTQLCSGTMCCQSGSQLRAHSFSNARLRPEAAVSLWAQLSLDEWMVCARSRW